MIKIKKTTYVEFLDLYGETHPRYVTISPVKQISEELLFSFHVFSQHVDPAELMELTRPCNLLDSH
jgi:hypothetical protein